MLVDVHAHIDDEAFDIDREAVIERIKSENMLVINASSDNKTVETTYQLARDYDFIYAVLGIHPYDAKQTENLSRIKSLLEDPKVVGIGEIGLDYHMDDADKELQKKAFIKQIELAGEYRLPIVVHDRDAHKDTLDILKTYLSTTCVMHCFSGSWDMAKECLDMGMYLSFGGVLTFKNAKKSVEAVKNIPLYRLLIETDCPYMTPEPKRGTRNEPINTRLVAKKIAEIKDIDVGKVIDRIYRNTLDVFNKIHL